MTRCKPFESELTAVNQQTRADRCMSLACTNIRDVEHDWFANLTELRETSYDATRGEMVIEGTDRCRTSSSLPDPTLLAPTCR